MDIYEKLTIKILFYLDEINKNDDFKKINPGITSQEYLYLKVNPNITQKRLANILNGKAKRITLKELYIISNALNIELIEFFKDIK